MEGINLIWHRPGCRGGRATLIGRGLKVKFIVVDYLDEEHCPTEIDTEIEYERYLKEKQAAGLVPA